MTRVGGHRTEEENETREVIEGWAMVHGGRWGNGSERRDDTVDLALGHVKACSNRGENSRYVGFRLVKEEGR